MFERFRARSPNPSRWLPGRSLGGPITASATLQVIYYPDSATAKTVFEARKQQDTAHNEQEVSGVGDSAFSAGDSPVLGILKGRVILVVGVTSESAQQLLDQEIQIAKDAVATLG
jgi:hypothetical protein